MDRFGLYVKNLLGHNEFCDFTSNICPGTDMNAVRKHLGDEKKMDLSIIEPESDKLKKFSSGILDILAEIGWAVVNKFPGGSVLTGVAERFLSLFSSNQDVWNKFLEHFENLINIRLNKLVKASALSELDGIGRVYQSYVRAFNIWDQKKTEENASNLRTQFIATETYIRGRVQSAFNIRNFEVNLLTVCTQASNIHLSIMSDAVESGLDWGFNDQALNNYHVSLKNKIHEYTNQCYKNYQMGLENMKGNRFVDWCFFNRFR